MQTPLLLDLTESIDPNEKRGSTGRKVRVPESPSTWVAYANTLVPSKSILRFLGGYKSLSLHACIGPIFL